MLNASNNAGAPRRTGWPKPSRKRTACAIRKTLHEASDRESASQSAFELHIYSVTAQMWQRAALLQHSWSRPRES